MEVKIYIDGKLLDLFPTDNSISFQAKLVDVEKLSNVFTDISQQFSVPSTANNDAIFKHYYDVDVDGGFNAAIRVLALIELDSFTFRYGKIQLGGVNMKFWKPDSYKITFYGGLTQLADLFGDDTIDKLDYFKQPDGTLVKTWDSLSRYDYNYTSFNFFSSFNNPDFLGGNIITPLIAWTNRDWNYGTDDTTDIETADAAILDSELRPALRIYNIITGIETKYGINFSRQFFGKAVFNNLYMWLNANSADIANQAFDFDIIAPFSGTNDGSLTVTNDYVNLTRRQYTEINAVRWKGFVDFTLTPAVGYEDVHYDILIVDEDGVTLREFLDKSGTYTAGISWTSSFKNQIDTTLVTEQVKFVVRPKATLLYNGSIDVNYYKQSASVIDTYVDAQSTVNPQTNLIVIDISQNIPKMKVTEFFQGIMKMFKLMIRPLSTNIFEVNTWDGWYNEGKILNISEFVDGTDIRIEPPVIYKTIEFKYQESELVLGKQYREVIKDPANKEIGYGDLKAEYAAVDTKSELNIDLPFEALLMERMTNADPNDVSQTNILIGQSITVSDDGSIAKASPRPILFFNNGIVDNSDTPFYVKFTTNPAALVQYNYLMGTTNDELLSQVTDTLNFGAEIDPWHLTEVDNSLYLNYWSNWINEIYSLKQRKWQFNATLPPRYVDEISLNDRLIIRNNRYKISDYNIDLVTGETQLNLFNDIFTYGPPAPLVSTESIQANAGIKYYGIELNTQSTWTISKVDTGDGTDWVEILTPTGTGSTEIVIKTYFNYNIMDRSMQLLLTLGTGETRTISLLQNGIPL